MVYSREQRDELKEKLIDELEKYFGDDVGMVAHSKDVLRFAEELLEHENADSAIVMPASILHDVGIKVAKAKYGSSAGPYQEKEGPPVAKEILKKLNYDEGDIEEVCEIIAHHHSPGIIETQNFKVLYDADWLVNIRGMADKMSKDELRDFIGQTFLTDFGKKLALSIYVSG